MSPVPSARKCTCLVDTESDSEDEASVPSVVAPAAASADSSDATDAIAAAAAELGKADLRRKVSGYRDAISTSTALHNSEALRQAHVLQNVFCACYDVETVISQVQRRERSFSPVQVTLLRQESIATVFRYATSLPERSSNAHSAAGVSPDRYRRSVVATEIILKFYLKAMAWHGVPKPPAVPSPPNNSQSSRDEKSPGGAKSPLMFSPPTSPNQQRRRFSADASSVVSPTHTRQILSFGSTYKAKAQKRGINFSHSFSLHDVSNSIHSGGLDAIDSPEVRGYLLRLEDLTEAEWKSIFTQLYTFLWEKKENAVVVSGRSGSFKESAAMQSITEGSSSAALTDDDAVDNVLAANMCKITKHLIVFPSVHKLLASIECPGPLVDGIPSTTTLFPALAPFVYSNDIATLLHGVIHIAQRRQMDLDGIIQSIVYQIASVVPTGAARYGGQNGTIAPIFNVKKPRFFHDTISGCADILTKILMQQFPNTFRYYIHSKVQLASFESVEPFERELFPPKVPPSDQSLHGDIKSAVMTALMEERETLMKLADIALAEVRFLDAYQSQLSGIPPTLVIDVIRCAIECSMNDRPQLELFLPCVYRLVDTFCAAINFHQHMTTISEFASRDCFSDSDSDDGSNGIDEDDDEEEDESPTNREPSDDFIGGKQLQSSLQLDDEEFASTKDSMASTSSSSITFSPSASRLVVNHRPLSSILLIVSIVEFLDTAIRMGVDTIDNRLVRLDLSTSLLDVFDKFPKANVLHCRLLKLYLNLVDRNTTGRVNNPFLRSVFRPPHSLQEFIMKKLHQSPKTHPYDPHLSILGVKIDKICSSPSLQQELIRQYCAGTPGWSTFASSLVARHYQQIDALDDLAFNVSAAGNGGGNASLNRRSIDGIDDVFPTSRSSSSSCDFLTDELQPFRRLPMEKEGFGSSQNLADGSDAVLATDMLKSRAQSQFPESIIDILRKDTSTSFEATEDERTIVGFAYQKLAKWVKVQIKFDKTTCMLIVQDASKMSSSNSTSKTPSVSAAFANGLIANSNATSAGSNSTKKPTSKLKELWNQHKRQWATPRPKKFVVCTARKWIAFGRTVKNPNVGAFGFQIDVFDRIREEDQTLTFVTRSEQTRTLWFETLQNAVSEARTLRHQSFTEVDEEANIMLVKCVATQREGSQMVYLALPDVHVLSPVISSSFSLKSEVPEDIPFWGTFQGPHGVSKYCSLFNSCLHVVSVQEKRVYASGYSVVVEFDVTVQAIEGTAPATPVIRKPTTPNVPGRMHLQLQLAPTPDPEKTVTCSFTDTYLVSGNQIISMTRTIADSEKLVKILCDDRAE